MKNVFLLPSYHILLSYPKPNTSIFVFSVKFEKTSLITSLSNCIFEV